MIANPPVVRDERTVAVENASYRWTTIFLTYALLVDVMYRGVVRDEAAWDLLALVIVAGAVSTAYQAREKTLSFNYWKAAALVALLGGVIGAITAAIMVWVRG